MATHGRPLLQELQRALPTLSPKLGGVARFCIQHAATLHHYRIQDVADACDTMPVSVVRLAQRFGLKGFQELKLAFIDRVEAPEPLEQPGQAPPSTECAAALQDIEASAQGVTDLKALVLRPEFLQVAQALRGAPHIRFDWASDEDRWIATHLQARMRSVGCRQVDGGTRSAGAVQQAAWLVQVAVWDDMAPAPGWFAVGEFGPRVLKLSRGNLHRMNRLAALHSDGVVIQVGTDARRMLNALALCEALVTAVRPDRVGCGHC